MPVLQQLVAQTVIATMAFGGIACMCPAEAAGMAASLDMHGQHQHGHPSPPLAERDDCDHADCGNDCDRVSAAAPKVGGAAPGKGALQLDDDDPADNIPPGAPEPLPRTREIVRTDPPWCHAWLSPDTPVQRFDRLLD